MFKFDPKQVILDQSLRNDHTRWIAPYKEGSDEQKWVVKCIHVHKHEEINNILQNMFLQTSSNSVGLLPIMGYDVQKDELGQSKIYMRMPRLKESLRNIIDEYRNSFDNVIPIEKIVCYLYSVATTLDELAQKHIFHRNLKPTNVLVDSEGVVYLTDLKLNQYNIDINEQKHEYEETPNAPDNNTKNNSSSENNDLLYLAPELYNNSLLPTEEDIYKADVWSLGMIISEACLMEKLQFTPPEFPLQDQIDTADQNIAEIRNKYGGNLSKVMASILHVNPSERSTFKEICENLEENFSNIVSSKENTELMKLSWKSKTNSKIFYSDYSIDEENNDLGNPFLKEEEISHRHAFMLDLSQSKDNILDRSIDFSYENKQGFYQKAIRMKNRLKIKLSQAWEKPFKLKDVARYFKVTLTLAMLVLLVYSLSHRILEERGMKYMKAIRGLEMKYSDQFKLTLENFNTGALTVETIGGGGHHKTEYWNLPNSPWEFRRDAALDSLLRDLATEVELEKFVTSLTELRIVLTEPLRITDRIFEHLQIALLKFKSLKGFSFLKIEGEITDLGVNSFMTFLAQNFKDLESLNIGFTKGGSDEHERDSRLTIDGLYPFANEVLKNFKKLTSYTITFERMDIVTDVLLKQLGAHLNEYGGNLKYFDLKTSGCTKITSEGLKQFNSVFLNSLVNVVRLGLNYKGTNIDSEGLNQLVTSVCEKAKNIDTFGFSVENTDINAEDFSSVVTILKQNTPKTLKRLLIQTSIWERDFPTKLHEQLNFIPEVMILP